MLFERLRGPWFRWVDEVLEEPGVMPSAEQLEGLLGALPYTPPVCSGPSGPNWFHEFVEEEEHSGGG